MKHKQYLKLFLFLTSMVLLLTIRNVSAAPALAMEKGLERPTFVDLPSDALDTMEVMSPKMASTYQSSWEKYSTYFYYNQLTQQQRVLYDRLNSLCLAYLEDDYDATICIINGVRIPITALCETNGLTGAELERTMLLFYYSNPQYYYLRSSFVRSRSADRTYIGLCFYDDFQNGAKRKSCTKKFKQQVDAAVAEIQKEKTPLAKEKKAHDLITKRVVYKFTPHNQSAYSTFLEGGTVCAGYSFAFSMLCNAVGIDTAMVTSEDHAWNYVRLNNSWYYVDCTWDDSTDGYYFFNRNKDMFLKLSGSDAKHHYEEALWNGLKPSCSLDSGATKTRIGTIYTPTKKAAAPKIITSNKNNGYSITLKGEAGTSLYYTTDGSTPSVANRKSYKYRGSFFAEKNKVVRAIAVKDRQYDSTASATQPATPRIAKQPSSKSVAYKTSAPTIRISAKCSDGGRLSYQWYQNKTNSNRNGQLIKGATAASYRPSTSRIGTSYYYCVVTNKNSAATIRKSVSTTSAVSKVTVGKRNLSSAKLSSVRNQTYQNKPLSPSFKVTWGKDTLHKNKDYTVQYSHNKEIGKATITILGKGTYTGKKSISFSILPKDMNLTKLSAKKRSLVVTWKRDPAVQGYQLQYATKRNFSGKKTITIKKASVSSATIQKLAAKKGYYIRIRSYKKQGHTTYYSKWSKTSYCKTK